jgi:hypothetical protein
MISEESDEGEGEDGRTRKFTFSKLRRQTEKDVSRFSIKESENGGNSEYNQEMENCSGNFNSIHLILKWNVFPNFHKNFNKVLIINSSFHLLINFYLLGTELNPTKNLLQHPIFKIHDQNFVIQEVEGEDKNSNKSFDIQPYNTLLTQVDLNNSTISDDKKSENKIKIKITASEIINQMSQNEFTTFKESNTNQYSLTSTLDKKKVNYSEPDLRKIQREKTEPETKVWKYSKKFSSVLNTTSDRTSIKGKTLLKSNNKDENYKEFFSLTYQCLKLNSEDIEPFLYVVII